MKILVNKIRCNLCGDEIESKTVHDFKFCKCHHCAVDGGHEYLRRLGAKEDFTELSVTEPEVTVYGESDDLVDIFGSLYREDEIGAYEQDVRIRFVDGTVIRCGYPKRNHLGVWWIQIEKKGTAPQTLEICMDENDYPHSDVFTIQAEVKSHSVIKQKYAYQRED